MRQYILAISLSVLSLGIANSLLAAKAESGNPPDEHDPRLSGGATTVADTSRNAFSRPARNLSILRRDNFFIGNAFFRQPWVIAPASTTARDGLGALFNANTCQGCHVKDGRGKPPLKEGESFQSMLVRLSIPAESDKQIEMLKTHGVVPEPNYGEQLQTRGIPGVLAEANPRLTYEEIPGEFKDGSTYTLLKPTLHLDEPGYGGFHQALQTSLRVAPVMIGMGLLEAIPEADILSISDSNDEDGDGISGRPNRVWDISAKQTKLGRFGWKAGQPSVAQQSAAAFVGDMGLTTEIFPEPNCTDTQANCSKAPSGGVPEVSAKILSTVVFYSSTLAVPARRNVQDPEVRKGEGLFAKANCIGCHVARLKTGNATGFPELSDQVISPYTDLLLHDMGEGLADNRPEFIANGREWRTPPLWGIGLVKTVNDHTRFLHDGRARNLLEAILWHGGEAEKAKQAVLEMDQAERDALIAFLESL